MSRSHIPAETRRRVRQRANGRCEYCLLPEEVGFVPHEVDHVVAEKHGGRAETDNLALCCTLCNKYKGTDLTSIDPETGSITPLYHPRRDRWAEHFRLDQGLIVPLTATGRVSVALLRLNDPHVSEVRRLLLAKGIDLSQGGTGQDLPAG